MNAHYLGTIVDKKDELIITKWAGRNGLKPPVYFCYNSPSPAILQIIGKYPTLTEARRACCIDRPTPAAAIPTLPKSAYAQNRDGYKSQSKGKGK